MCLVWDKEANLRWQISNNILSRRPMSREEDHKVVVWFEFISQVIVDQGHDIVPGSLLIS
jgi:hypothetical protein